MEPPPGLVGLLFPRSGLGHKHGVVLGNGIGVIDPDYRGEVKVSLLNRGSRVYVVSPGERIAQLVLVPFYYAHFEEEPLSVTERGEQGFGDSGKH